MTETERLNGLFTGPYEAIPEHMRFGMIAYVEKRLQPGGFLTAIICNDLRGAVAQADDENMKLIPLYVQWFYNKAPLGCWGSVAAFEDWLEGPEQD